MKQNENVFLDDFYETWEDIPEGYQHWYGYGYNEQLGLMGYSLLESYKDYD